MPDLIEIAPLQEAIAKIDAKTPVGSALRSKEWEHVPLALRERAQFSAGVESARVLAAIQDRLRRAIAMQREVVGHDAQGREKTALMDRDTFIAEVRKIAAEEGVQTVGSTGAGTVQDIRSARRLALIHDMQTRQAHEYARWKMDQDPDVLDGWPAQRLVRLEPRRVPRNWDARWQAAGDRVGWDRALRAPKAALKTSPIWQALSRFGTPWPPFDFGSGMGLEDMDRDEAERLGLLKPDEPVEPTGEADFNARLEASVSGLDEAALARLKASFGDQVQVDRRTGKLTWQGNLLGDLFAEVERTWRSGQALSPAAFKGQSLNLGTASPELQRQVAGLTDTTGAPYRLEGAWLQVRPDSILHMLERHGEGKEKRADQRPIGRLDVELIPHVWRAPDRVEPGSKPRSLQLEKRLLGRHVLIEYNRSPNGEAWEANTLLVKREARLGSPEGAPTERPKRTRLNQEGNRT